MDNAYKIACCVTCTLSNALKLCNKGCTFNIGLSEREAQRAALKPGLKINQSINSNSGDSNPEVRQ